jgi:flagellar L-ring protein precursor FlgH
MNALVPAILLAALAAGCTVIEPRIAMPEVTTAVPRPVVREPARSGAIFQANAPFRGLAEDRRPMYPGDILTVAINERSAASRSSKSAAAKTGEFKAEVPLIKGFRGAGLGGAEAGASANNKFEGSGETANENAFSGTITVTVIERLANGNLVVAGDKQIGINHNTETIRFSGVVDPLSVLAGNVVSSTAVADARLEYRGKGYIDEAQRMGWLTRFFLSALPF